MRPISSVLLALLAVVASTPAASADEPAKVMCIAGCGSTTPVQVYQRPAPAPTGSGVVAPRQATAWKEHTFDVWCADGLGCKALNNIRIGQRSHSTYFYGVQFWR